MRAFVFEGITRECLAVVRSLGRRGVKVDVGDPHTVNPARFSKYTSDFYKYPDPKTHPEEHHDWLMSHLRKVKYDMIFPLNDHTYEVCTRHQDEIGKLTAVAVNDWDTFELARDKEKTLRHALATGFPVPKTWFPAEYGSIEGLADQIDEYPVLLKPSHSSGSRGVRKVGDRSELIEIYDDMTARYGKMLVQDFIPGNEIQDVPMIFNLQGQVRGALVNNRIRMYPNEGGPNVAGCAIRDDNLRDDAIRFMEKIGWRGVGLVEVKRDPRDGKPKLMEINPRFWGTTQLGISAGIDWPWMLLQATLNGDCEAQMEYKEGIVLRWLIPGELMHFITSKNRRALFPDFFRFRDPSTEYYVFRREDLRPALGLFLTLAAQILNPKMVRYYLKRNSV